MFNKRCYDNSMSTGRDTFSFESSMNIGMNEYPEAVQSNNMMGGMIGNSGSMMPPVYECPQERVINREIIHEVPHVCPINTRIVNHHIYRHTYSPCYTCSEENCCTNIYDRSCCNF